MSGIKCPRCRRAVPSCSICCVYCSEVVTRPAVVDGQLALLAGQRSVHAFALLSGGSQCVVVDVWEAPRAQAGGGRAMPAVRAKVRPEGRQGDVEVVVPLDLLVLAAQEGNEVIDVSW